MAFNPQDKVGARARSSSVRTLLGGRHAARGMLTHRPRMAAENARIRLNKQRLWGGVYVGGAATSTAGPQDAVQRLVTPLRQPMLVAWRLFLTGS